MSTTTTGIQDHWSQDHSTMENFWNLVSEPHATTSLSHRHLQGSNNSTSTIPTGYSQSQVDDVCRRAEELSSLTCSCGSSFQRQVSPRYCHCVQGPDGFDQDLLSPYSTLLNLKSAP